MIGSDYDGCDGRLLHLCMATDTSIRGMARAVDRIRDVVNEIYASWTDTVLLNCRQEMARFSS